MITPDKPKIFLIDAYALIYRAFFALNKNPRVTSKGFNTSAIIGFLNTLYEILRTERPSHLGIAFDLGAPSQRTENFSDYKANREAMPDDLRASIPYIKEIIKGFNIPMYAVEGYEADDVIGTLAKKAEKAGHLVYMVTPDKDFGQLVSDNIFIFRPAKFGEDAKILGPKEVCEKYGIDKPTQLIDILGLWGDAIDNIPGIPGVGEKTASKFVQEYGSMENLIAHAGELKGKMRENIINFADQGLMSKMLATININVPVDFNINELAVKTPDMQRLTQIFDELEFRTFSKRMINDLQTGKVGGLPVQQPAVVRPGTKTDTSRHEPDLFSQFAENDPSNPSLELFSTKDSIKTVSHDYQLVATDGQISSLIEMLQRHEVFAFDTETTGLDVCSSEIIGMSFSVRAHEAFYVTLPDDFEAARRVIERFVPLFSDTGKTLVGQNIKFDMSMLAHYNISLKNKLFDTMLAHYLIDPEQRHNMDYLADVYLNYETLRIEELIGRGKSQVNMRMVPLEPLKDYAAEDADVTYRLYEVFKSQLAENQLTNLFEDMEMPLVEVLSTMECNGVKIDSDNLKQISDQQAKQIKELESQIFANAGKEFNIASPKQLGEILFDDLKIKAPAKKTKTGQYPTGEEVLQKIITAHPIVQEILDWRGLSKLKSTYVDALPALINPCDGLVHTSYNQAVTATGRLSSTNPNLQNIPVRTDNGREIRKAFVPRDENHVLLAADYSQIELRIITHLSGDPAMTEAFNAGVDIHAATAARVYGVELEDVTKDMRRRAKAVNFGIIYGMSAFGLAERIGISRGEAAEIIKSYFREYAGIQEYIDRCIASARQNGYVETMFGRRRYLRDINSTNSVVRQFAERNAINSPIQGSSADMIKIAMANIHKELKNNDLKSKMILQVHDELVFDTCIDELDTVKKIVKDKMENAMKLNIPVVAELNVGENWLEAH
ncbi:MAG: DNA polymerase I [Bacteroidales bacterium]|nr:DNA polymerase I [Bacteroidales bacterium]